MLFDIKKTKFKDCGTRLLSKPVITEGRCKAL